MEKKGQSIQKEKLYDKKKEIRIVCNMSMIKNMQMFTWKIRRRR